MGKTLFYGASACQCPHGFYTHVLWAAPTGLNVLKKEKTKEDMTFGGQRAGGKLESGGGMEETIRIHDT